MRRLLAIAGGLVAVAVSVVLIYSWLSFSPAAVSLDEVLAQYPDLRILTRRGEVAFWPGQPQEVGLIFYAGGNVDYLAYSLLAASIAQEGFPVFLVRMPLNLAILHPQRAQAVIRQHDQVKQWVIAGHSLGGVMAVRFAVGHPATVSGVILYASYPDQDLREAALPALSLVGTEDGVLSWARYEQALTLLPRQARVIAITGGNHSFFGDYGLQKGDNPATITQEQQRAQVAEETVMFLRQLLQ